MRKKLLYFFIAIIGIFAIAALPEVIAITRFDVRANDRKISALDNELANLRAEYLKILFDDVELDARGAGFVAISEAHYLNPSSAVAQR